MRVVLIGHGAVARAVATLVAERDSPVEIVGVLVRPGRAAAHADTAPAGARVVESVAAALELAPDVVGECAGHAALRDLGPEILRRGVDVAAVSTGVLADDAVRRSLVEAAEAGGARLHVCAGALAGIDALAAARRGGLSRVVHTIVKPCTAWRGTPAEEALHLDGLSEATAFFQGTAREAARDYPQNANATATVALAGLGLDHTRVELVADPAADGNRHVLAVEGAFGAFDMEIRGRPLADHPKTSSLTAYSLLRALENGGLPLSL